MKRWMVASALGATLLLAAAVRLYDIGGVPTEMDADEIDLYNSAYSYATTGHDVDGRRLPFLYSRLTRNPPVYAVAAYTSSLAFGRTPLGLRLPAVLFGLVAILLLYGIAFELTKRTDIALFAALLMATQPIFVHFSRIGWEPASELPFLLGGLFLLLRALGARALLPAPMFAAAVVLGLTAYTYMAGWFYALLLGGALLALNAPRCASRRDFRYLVMVTGCWLLVAAPALRMWFFDEHTASHTLRIATFAAGVSADAVRTFLLNYAAHFTWSYLVTTGHPQPAVTWRYLNGFGAFFGWTPILAAVGCCASARYIRPRWALVWTWLWLVAYPLGGALTNDGPPGTPNAPRTLAGAPVFCIFAALGLAFFIDWAASLRPARLARAATVSIVCAFVLAVLLSTANFARYYFTRYVHQNSNAWFSGTRALFLAVRANRDDYTRICFSVLPAWYPLQSYVRFYLNDTRLEVVDGTNDVRCSQPRTLVAVDSEHAFSGKGLRRLAHIEDVDGNLFATLNGYP